jgi:hypothetical protein
MQRQDALLCSINDRLGGNEGQDVAPLSGEYLTDLLALNQQEAEDAENEDEAGGDAGQYDDMPPEWETI